MPSPPAPESDAVQRAIDYGIDVTLLIENLRSTPTQRVRYAEAAIRSLIAFRDEVQRTRSRR